MFSLPITDRSIYWRLLWAMETVYFEVLNYYYRTSGSVMSFTEIFLKETCGA
jgi:hypothetical protein